MHKSKHLNQIIKEFVVFFCYFVVFTYKLHFFLGQCRQACYHGAARCCAEQVVRSVFLMLRDGEVVELLCGEIFFVTINHLF